MLKRWNLSSIDVYTTQTRIAFDSTSWLYLLFRKAPLWTNRTSHSGKRQECMRYRIPFWVEHHFSTYWNFQLFFMPAWWLVSSAPRWFPDKIPFHQKCMVVWEKVGCFCISTNESTGKVQGLRFWKVRYFPSGFIFSFSCVVVRFCEKLVKGAHTPLNKRPQGKQ